MFEYFFNMPAMFEYIIGVDKYIIQIYHNIDIQNIREQVIYESLKALVEPNNIINHSNNL